jgi:ApbE superfamily uncharacterized protein (UPF0280 family)
MKNEDRYYRSVIDTARWTSFRTRVETTDLLIRAGKDLSVKAEQIVKELRGEIRKHIGMQEEFLTSYSPVKRLPRRPEIINNMYRASELTDTGPMASVAGAIAESLGNLLLQETEEIIIENGGDVWLKVTEPVLINILSKSVYFHDNIILKIYPDKTPCGICTSSGKIGYSFSYGRADSATVISGDAAFADAAATGACNLITNEDSLMDALAYCMKMEKTRGTVLIFRDRMALQGDIELADPEA